MSNPLISVRVWGDFACFTRPEMKVERVSYPIMTPSAARGVLEAIFWEPQMYYLIDTIRVIKKGRWISLRRNEVKDVVSIDQARRWSARPESFTPIAAGGGVGAQRCMLALADIEYVITAEVLLTNLGRGDGQDIKKYTQEIRRRALAGKCFHRPALGLREFAADFEWADDPEATLKERGAATRADRNWEAIWPCEDLGLMLFDVFDLADREIGFQWVPDDGLKFRGNKAAPRAWFFHAEVKQARMCCHPSRIQLLGRTPQGDAHAS